MLLNISVFICFKPTFGTYNNQPIHSLCHLLISIQSNLPIFFNQFQTPKQIPDNDIVLRTL